MSLWLPTFFTVAVTIIFLVWERIVPGRELPNSKGWYARVLFVNALQIGITFATNKLWFNWLSGFSLFHIAGWNPVLQGFVGWLVSTFFFFIGGIVSVMPMDSGLFFTRYIIHRSVLKR